MRCKACNKRLEDSDLLLKDNDLCGECRYKGSELLTINDLYSDFGNSLGIPLDGTTLKIEDWYESDNQD